MEKFFPTTELKEASENKPIVGYLPEDGRDPNPAWDLVANAVWPATKENQTAREALADAFMVASNTASVYNDARNAALIMARMSQILMGKSWVDRWLWDNSDDVHRGRKPLPQKVHNIKRIYESLFV